MLTTLNNYEINKQIALPPDNIFFIGITELPIREAL